MAAFPVNNSLAFDTRSLDALRSRAASDPKAAVRETARQFEALFMQELMKSMRSTTLAGGGLAGLGGDDGAGAKMGTEMLDTQYASQLSGMAGGLSEAITRHLERQMGLSPGPIPSARSANDTPPPLAAKPVPTRIPQTGAAGFVQQHSAAAREAEAATGIPAAFMVAQAAHETGWGRKEIRHADGTPAFNLFGIKAAAGWRGPVAEVTTTEYVNGQAKKVVAKFRAYASYAESFADYARLMNNSQRYQGVVGKVTSLASAAKGADAAVGFAQGLQRAGYATDPAYADKLTRVINTTLRLQRSLA
ncbi:MAG: flagellar assembly peptidoglycan hydrolase FlgJ [Rubrivivax sp.]|nr:flagellar assembly peptidoglycan hydrolase FlgJ [Rubrivivax sp.]